LKTTITGIVGLVALIAAKFGFQLDVETQLAIVTLVLFVLSILAKDDGGTPKAA
jgi:hypothetical protein